MSRLLNTPLLAHPGKALIVYEALCGRFGTPPATIVVEMPPGLRDRMMVRRPEGEESRFAGQWMEAEGGRGVEPFRVDEGVGILSITGTLVNRGAWVGQDSSTSQTSYEGIRYQLQRMMVAAQKGKIHSALLDMSTPGGEASGVYETTRVVRALSRKIPTVAVANGMMASAGYGIGVGARQVVNTESGYLGSVGTLILHMDYSKKIEAEGLKPTLIFSGAHKVDGNPLEALSESARAELQQEVDSFRDLFVRSIGLARRGRTSEADARGTEGRTFIGKDAVTAKLADDIGSFDEVLSDMKAAARAAAKKRSRPMEDDDEALTREEQDKRVKAAADKATADATLAATTAAQTAAAARMTKVLADPKVKGKDAFALKMLSKFPSMSAEDIIDLVDASPAPAAVNQTTFDARDAESGADKLKPGQQQQEQQPQASGVASVYDEKSGWAQAVSSVSKVVKSGRGGELARSAREGG